MPPAIMQRRVTALRAQGSRVLYYEYEGLGHGFGLDTGTIAAGWLRNAVRFWSQATQQER